MQKPPFLTTAMWSLMFLGCFGNIATAQENGSDVRIQIGFGSTINDGEISALMKNYPMLKPEAAFMWASGISGTYRNSQRVDLSDFMKEARIQTAEHLGKGLINANRLIEVFLSTHSEEQLGEEEALQTQARSLLNLKKQYENALATTLSGGELIYALEINGPGSAVDQILFEPQVSVSFRPGETPSAGRANRRSLKPQAYVAEYRDPEVLTKSLNDLYSLLANAIAVANTGE